MKHLAWFLPWLAVAIVACCRPSGDGVGARSAPKQPANNSSCHVCHMNYEEDKLAVRHARIGVGCVKCHGESSAHCNDENNVTPPDLMYPAGKISPSCMRCHPAQKLAAADMHTLHFVGTAEEKKRCTECHGSHRLARRSVRWDKATGKLLPRS